MINLTYGTWDTIWSFLHRALVLNLALAVANLPLLLALAVVREPTAYPLFFGVLALSLGPSVAAAFGYLHGEMSYVTAYRRFFRAALLRGALTVALLGVLIADVVALHDHPAGAYLVPLFVVLAVLCTAAGVVALALLPLRPGTRLWAGLLTAAYAAVRRWWLSGLTLLVLAAAMVAVNQAPILGLATLPGCAMILAWVNSAASLREPRES
ncbi:putative membrane protein YesL [Catenuloplanes nepalensis]|uniref:Membrane protein YesL n=1 Tax=Catenuloplanes nepalensis TaxID=587533 RepID=A0ABT9MUY1_9ACTN|nr:hypothetical protein [Catenuloplanes nepalensis]MDP9795262.1 putative membrane protein YesL [Catenuloplanes nepalensis]